MSRVLKILMTTAATFSLCTGAGTAWAEANHARAGAQPKSSMNLYETADAFFNAPIDSYLVQLGLLIGDAYAVAKLYPKTVTPQKLDATRQRLVDEADAAVKSINSVEGKAAQIERAALDVQETRLQAIRDRVAAGRLPPWIGKTARIIGTTLFIVDGAGRVWEWAWTDANPTISPALQLFFDGMSDMSARASQAPKSP